MIWGNVLISVLGSKSSLDFSISSVAMKQLSALNNLVNLLSAV